MSLADNLKTLRNQKQLTQRELAKALNISNSALAMYEIGKREPDIEILTTIANFFNISLDELIKPMALQKNNILFNPSSKSASANQIQSICRSDPESAQRNSETIRQLGQEFAQEVQKNNTLSSRIEEIKKVVQRFKEELVIVNELPVDVFNIYKLYGWALKWTDKLEGETDAVTFCYQGFFGTYISTQFEDFPERVRFTLGHEIGHIILNHFQDCSLDLVTTETVGLKKIAELNRDANLFCAELLMPDDYLIKNADKGIEYLRKACGVSYQAMEYRLKNLGLLGSK